MKLTINVKPTICTATTRNEINNKITRGKSYCSGASKTFSYSGYTDSLSVTKEKITVFNLHKVRRKVIQKKDKDNKTKSKVISASHWIAYVYNFDLNMLKAMGVKKITQKTRNFEIIK